MKINIKILFFVLTAFLAFEIPAAAQKKAVNPDSPEDVTELKADAERGDRGAQYELSMVYAYKQDAVNALKWLTKSAENGYGRAQYTLGNLYYNGNAKIKRDYERALLWFEASKRTKYKGSKVDELISSAKEKLEEQKKAAQTRKKALLEAKAKAAAQAKKKAREDAAAALKAAEEAAAKARQAVREAQEAAKEAAMKTAAETEIAEALSAQKPARGEEAGEGVIKSLLRKIKDKISAFFG